MATYYEIRNYVQKKHHRVMKDCWIAHAKEKCGLRLQKTRNRHGIKRKILCPAEKFEWIKEAFIHFKMI